jgi:hypothetical protein
MLSTFESKDAMHVKHDRKLIACVLSTFES